MSPHPFLSVLLLSTVAAAQSVTARVNDSRSHGLLGDNFLSLNEAIQLVRGDITIAQLSQAEQARIQGIGSVVDSIQVDAAVTPVITYEAELAVFVPPSHIHTEIMMEGLATASGALPGGIL